MIREELRRIFTWEERHRRLVARIGIAVAATVVVDAVGSILIWHWERGAAGSEVHSFGDAVFFVTVQILTVSSQLKNPVTTAGRVIDIVLQVWAIFVVTAVAGSFGAFFTRGDASS
jgi:Ion channel